MTAKQKCDELISRIFEKQHVDDHAKMICISTKQIALFVVDEIESALTEYGKRSNELQNMDDEFRWWDEIRLEINKL